MTNLRHLSKMQLAKNKYILIALILLSFLGFLDSTYLAILHFQNTFPSCSILYGCEIVLSSIYSSFFGIPTALFGSFYFAAIFIFLIWIFEQGKLIPIFFVFVTLLGAIGGIGLILIQAFVLRAFCQYCLVADVITSVISLLTFWLFRILKR